MTSRVEQDDPPTVREGPSLGPEVASAAAESVLEHERRADTVTLYVERDLVHGGFRV